MFPAETAPLPRKLELMGPPTRAVRRYGTKAAPGETDTLTGKCFLCRRHGLVPLTVGEPERVDGNDDDLLRPPNPGDEGDRDRTVMFSSFPTKTKEFRSDDDEEDGEQRGVVCVDDTTAVAPLAVALPPCSVRGGEEKTLLFPTDDEGEVPHPPRRWHLAANLAVLFLRTSPLFLFSSHESYRANHSDRGEKRGRRWYFNQDRSSESGGGASIRPRLYFYKLRRVGIAVWDRLLYAGPLRRSRTSLVSRCADSCGINRVGEGTRWRFLSNELTTRAV